ncbi:IS110 family transposase [Streptomyces yunnanensis]|uniref:Transposase n=1 Tax=Streptomyces yunnanensis TaxID=156453 RepID=A0A9X8QUP7_9ACTN|nr:transposase [Streptomyces yunnanensis]SHM25922.1 Transposase [Streptomyces yunnanensis]
MEGAGSYGAGPCRYLLAQHVEVFNVHRPDRSGRRRRGKSDALDAQNAARAVVSGRVRARAKSGDGPVQSVRMFKLAKGSAVKARTQAINQLKAVLVAADPAQREELPGLRNPALIRTCARLADNGGAVSGGDAVLLATRTTLRLLAQRVERHFPQVLVPVGIGPDTAVTLLIIVGDNPDCLGPFSFAAYGSRPGPRLGPDPRELVAKRGVEGHPVVLVPSRSGTWPYWSHGPMQLRACLRAGRNMAGSGVARACGAVRDDV